MDNYLLEQQTNNSFSGTVLVAQKGKVLLSKGYGMANNELKILNNEKTVFRIASLTKQFTAMAIMQLEEAGLLSTSDKIARFLPDYPHGQEISIRDLLIHSSGIPNYTEFADFPTSMALPTTREKLIATFQTKPLDFKPEEKIHYSNSGYVLLGLIIEKVSGKPYENYLEDNIFKPLGMNDTAVDKNSDVVQNRASGYYFSDGTPYNASYIDVSTLYAAGDLRSTVVDLYKWDRALYTDKPLSKNGILKMLTPYKDKNGFGFVIDTFNHHDYVYHHGGIPGFATEIFRFINDDVTIIVLSNSQFANTNQICQDLAVILL